MDNCFAYTVYQGIVTSNKWFCLRYVYGINPTSVNFRAISIHKDKALQCINAQTVLTSTVSAKVPVEGSSTYIYCQFNKVDT